MATGEPAWPAMTEGQWNLIAEGATSGTVDRLKSAYRYYVTHVLTGEAIPADSVKDHSPVAFEQSNQFEINSSAPIDIYMWPENSDTETDDEIEYGIQVII